MLSVSTASDEDDNAVFEVRSPASDGDPDSTARKAFDHPHAHDSRTNRHYKILVACLLLFSSLFSWSVYSSYTRTDPWEATRCRMAYMSPGYIRLEGLNASHSRLAGKYSLWLYREQGWDLSSRPHGVPVLFAPGNAGSYRQVRSLAAAAARQYYSSPGVPQDALLASGHQELDFFAADFNEDFSAFHAGTLKEQAEYLADCVRYILTLYIEQGKQAPDSVIVLAHSMGGVAARYMFLQDKFPPSSVKTLVTLSTPHLLPPATFDRGVESIYSKINNYWRQSYESSSGPLSETLLISIAGGVADAMVSSDYTDLSSMLPPSNGFSVITTSIPTLYSPVDHLAMMWCDQLRQQVVSALIQCTDSRRRDRARPLRDRLAVFQDHLLTGLELQPTAVTSTGRLLSTADEASIPDNIALGTNQAVTDDVYMLEPLPSAKSAASKQRLQVTVSGDNVKIDYFACADLKSLHQCQRLQSPRYAHLPLEIAEPSKSLVESAGKTVFADLELPDSLPHAVLKISKEQGSSVYVRWSPEVREVSTTPLGMYIFGWQHDFALSPSVGSSDVFRFPNLDSSLIVYRLEVSPKHDCAGNSQIVRLSSGATFESHFFATPVKRATVHLHSGAPFLPASHPSNSLQLQVWHQSDCPASVKLSVDRKASLGTIVIRYRSILASWPVFIVLGILRSMLLEPHYSSKIAQSSTFEGSLRQFLLSESRCWLIILTAASTAQVILLHYNVFPHHIASILLGTRHLLFLLLAPAFMAVTTAIVLISHSLLRTATVLAVKVFTAFGTLSAPREERSRTRIIAFVTLSIFVMVFAPHQFAMLSLFLIHSMTTVRGFTLKSSNGKEVNYAILLLMFWLLPSNGAILIVWLRNLQAGWWWPFPSDHNILAILGPMLVVEHLRSGNALTMPNNKFILQVTNGLFLMSMSVVLLWGGRYVFVVGEMINIMFIWLAVLQYQKVRAVL